MIFTTIVATLLIITISITVWIVISTKNIPDVQKSTVKKLKQKQSRNECLKSFKNRAEFVKNNEIHDKDNILVEINHIINGINKNTNYDIHMAYSRLNEIDEKLKLSFLINNKRI